MVIMERFTLVMMHVSLVLVYSMLVSARLYQLDERALRIEAHFITVTGS